MPQRFRNYRYYLVILFLICACAAGCRDIANPPRDIAASTLKVLEDPSAEATIAQILGRRDEFRNVPVRVPNYGFTSSACWLRLEAYNLGYRTADLFLNLKNPKVDSLILYVVRSDGTFDTIESGDRLAARDRPYRATTLILPFSLDAGESVELYLRAWAEAAALMLPVEIVDKEGLDSQTLSEWFAHGTMLGLFATLFICNLFLFISLRERVYCYYAAYLFFACLTVTSLDGFGSVLLYPGAVWPGNEGLQFFTGITYLLILLFTRSFLNTREFTALDHLLKGLIGISVFITAASLLLPIRAIYQMSVAMMFVFPLICAAAGVITWRRGRLEARFYILGQVASWIGLLLFGLLMADVLPYHILLFHAISIGISMDALLLALALADRIRILQKERIRAENEARRNLELRRDELEQIVAKRTDELELARRQAELLATTDQLTGVLNRRGFLERAEHNLRLATRTGQQLSLALLDLDHFKQANDTHGHAEGDRVLRTVASLVNKTVRGTDILGRVGGEEFMLLMPNTPGAAAAQLAERIRQRIEEHFREGESPLRMTVSFGIAWVIREIDSLDALTLKADDALHRAKQKGRNRVELMTIGD